MGSRDAHRKRQGRRAEELARAWLAKRGYTIEATNVRFPVGEIDIVAREGKTLCFVEVRSTGSDAWGGPLASVTEAKRLRLIRAASWYLNRHGIEYDEVRFDVVALLWREDGEPVIEHVPSAFTTDDVHF
jgi:putative endonuclease